MPRSLAVLAVVALPHLAGCGQPVPEPAPAAQLEAPEPVGTQPARFPLQPGWIEETPSSSMRVAQFRLPGSGGAKDVELAVFSFPGGGSVESNFERWCSQFQQPDGRSSSEVAETVKETRDGLTIHRLEVGGRYVAETAPGSGVRLDEAGWKMIAAVLESPSGMHFVKAIGPEATLERWRASVDAFLGAVRP